jgi:hypothetical protein
VNNHTDATKQLYVRKGFWTKALDLMWGAKWALVGILGAILMAVALLYISEYIEREDHDHPHAQCEQYHGENPKMYAACVFGKL